MYAKNIRPSATSELRALGAFKLASEARDENTSIKDFPILPPHKKK